MSGTQAVSGGGLSPTQFVQAVLAEAKYASQQTGYPLSYVIAQWAHESNWGNSQAAKQDLNLSGIKGGGMFPYGTDKPYAGFNSVASFAQGYSQLLNTSTYSNAKQLAQNGAPAQQVFQAQAQAGFASDPNYGSSVAGFVPQVEGILNQLGANSGLPFTIGGSGYGISSPSGSPVIAGGQTGQTVTGSEGAGPSGQAPAGSTPSTTAPSATPTKVTATSFEQVLLNDVQASQGGSMSLLNPSTWLPTLAADFLGLIIAAILIWAGVRVWQGKSLAPSAGEVVESAKTVGEVAAV